MRKLPGNREARYLHLVLRSMNGGTEFQCPKLELGIDAEREGPETTTHKSRNIRREGI